MWPKLHGLELLRSIDSQYFETLPFVAIATADWDSRSDDLIQAILDADLGSTIAVRSCAFMEDAAGCEPPGFFDSVLNVAKKRTDLRRAIEQVIVSYKKRKLPEAASDKVIIQQQLLGSPLCGICRVGSASEYIEIDFDDTLRRTDAVTGGMRSKRVVLSACTDVLPSPWRQIRQSADQLRGYFPTPFFIEFALNAAQVPTLFQIRPDRRSEKEAPGVRPSCDELALIAETVGLHAPLSVMADWNPAEMLGLHPMQLDVSLYDELVTRSAWLEGRTSVGWRAPDDKNLMVEVAGRPYIKVRLSLLSLLPQALPSQLAERLVDDRLAVLSQKPQLHDKIEFQLVWSAFAFDQNVVASELLGRGFSPPDIEQLFDALKAVTKHALETAPHLLEADRSRAAHIHARRRMLSDADVSAPRETAEMIRGALATCRTYGTIPFSRQARLAFTYRFIIEYLVASGGVTALAVARWQAGLNSVARQLSRDLARVQNRTSSRDAFLDRYGHLRPGTYNLESLRYDERDLPATEHSDVDPGPVLAPADNPSLAALLAELGVACTQSEFWTAAAGAYNGREELKFHFTALLSDTLRLLARAAAEAGLPRQSVRQLPIAALLAAMDDARSWEDFARSISGWPAMQSSRWPQVMLPDIIFSANDLHVICEHDSRPTFVGQRVVAGPCRLIRANSSAELGELTGTIVAIETPDPGYDWIFGQRIGGLITAYGGEFSHMGLRCAEFGVPAALGCGPKIFTSATNADALELDPLQGEVRGDRVRLFP